MTLKVIEGHKRQFTLGNTFFFLANTFIYKSILIRIYINANNNIMNTQIFHLNKYDLKGH